MSQKPDEDVFVEEVEIEDPEEYIKEIPGKRGFL